MKLLLAAALVPALAVPAAAQGVANGSSRDKLVVSAAWLGDHVNDRDLVVLQVGTKDTYAAGHLPGARFVDFDNRALAARTDTPGAPVLEMPAPEALRSELAALGISDSSRIVVVASDNYWSPSTRIVYTLDYAGLTNVMWMDGGLKAWTDLGRPLSRDTPIVRPGSLGPLHIRPVVVDADFVQAHSGKPGFAIVDARTRNFYDGQPPRRIDEGPVPRNGHIPGAVSAPYDQFASSTAGGTTLKTAAEIERAFTQAGVKPGDTIIGYCHVGQQATAMLFAARTLGHNVLLYDGSFTEWQKTDRPIDNPSAGKEDYLVVSAAWLSQHLRDPGLVVLHVGDRAGYDSGHVPGARFTDGMDLHQMTDAATGLSLEMPPAAVLREHLAALGVGDGSRVIVYAGDGAWPDATRVLAALDYAGLPHVSFMNGGTRAWTGAGGALSKDAPVAKKGSLSPLTPRPLIVDAAFVRSHLKTPGFVIVDARARPFYDGSRAGGQPPTPGHIPGAVNIPFDSLVGADGRLKPQRDLFPIFNAAGVKAGTDTIVAYCHVGQQATAVLLAAKALGIKAVLYDGSFEDWSKRGLPVEK
jgi:thiosulfate/3-mercaptopyruvate sulfurtransferase